MDPTQSTAELTPVTTVPPLELPSKPQKIAPLWHTLVLAAFLVVTSLAGANSQHNLAKHGGKELLYGITMAMEWVMVGYVWLGTRRRISMRDLVGGRWNSVERVLLDFALGVGLYLAIVATLAVCALAMGMVSMDASHSAKTIAESKEKLGFILPTTNLQLLLFMLVSGTAGICEEIIFRGYFQRQFAAITGSVAGGLVIQALLFGAGHGYEGGKRMVLIAIEGVMFGVVVLWRKSVRPGMIAHASQDAISGAVGRLLLR